MYNLQLLLSSKAAWSVSPALRNSKGYYKPTRDAVPLYVIFLKAGYSFIQADDHESAGYR